MEAKEKKKPNQKRHFRLTEEAASWKAVPETSKAKQAANLLGRISEWLKLFVKYAEQLPDSRRCGLMLCRIFEDFGRFAFQSESRKGALAAVKCRI